MLFGGRSGEHEVSLASAASVIRGLDPDKYEAVPIGITKEGHWLIGAGAQKMLPEVLRGGQRVMMTADPTDAALVRLDGSGGGTRLDVVFPAMHGTFGEDGTIQGLLDLAGLPCAVVSKPPVHPHHVAVGTSSPASLPHASIPDQGPDHQRKKVWRW